jgi:hypothetical protein
MHGASSSSLSRDVNEPARERGGKEKFLLGKTRNCVQCRVEFGIRRRGLVGRDGTRNFSLGLDTHQPIHTVNERQGTHQMDTRS